MISVGVEGFYAESQLNTFIYMSLMEYIVHDSKNQIDSSFSLTFGAISLKRMRRFDLLTTDLGHALVVCDLTQTTLLSKVVHPKDKTPLGNKCGTIYHITCDNDLTHTYIGGGGSNRPLAVRFREHLNLLELVNTVWPLGTRCPRTISRFYAENRSGTDVKSKRPSTSSNTAPQ